jgi:hypothetical protein
MSERSLGQALLAAGGAQRISSSEFEEIVAEAQAKGVKPALSDRMGALLDARSEYLGALFHAINRDYKGVEGFLRDICKLNESDLRQLRYLYLQ